MNDRIIKYINEQNSKTKWYIFLLVVFSWVAEFHCISSVSVLEHILLHKNGLDNTKYSLLYSMVFLFAIVGSFIAPKLIVKYNLYVALIITQAICMFGQFLAMTAGLIIDADDDGDSTSDLYYILFLLFLYCGRGLIGTSFGLSDVIVASFMGAWFKNEDGHDNSNGSLSIIATMISIAHSNLGAISAMYSLILIYNTNNSLAECFLVGVLMCALSIICCYTGMLIYNRGKTGYVSVHSVDPQEMDDTNIDQTDQNSDKNSGSDNDVNDDDDSVTGDMDIIDGYSSDFSKIKHFSLRLWLIIACIMIGEANFETFFGQMVEVLIYKYDINELHANMALSSSPIFGMIFIPFFGYLSIKYNKNNSFAHVCLTLSMISFSLSTFILLIDKNNDNGLNNIYPWLSMIIENLAIQWWWSSSWTLLYNECPVEMHPIASSVATILFSIGSIIQMQLFGILADLTNGYHVSMVMVTIIPLFGFGFAILIRGSAKKDNVN